VPKATVFSIKVIASSYIVLVLSFQCLLGCLQTATGLEDLPHFTHAAANPMLLHCKVAVVGNVPAIKRVALTPAASLFSQGIPDTPFG